MYRVAAECIITLVEHAGPTLPQLSDFLIRIADDDRIPKKLKVKLTTRTSILERNFSYLVTSEMWYVLKIRSWIWEIRVIA